MEFLASAHTLLSPLYTQGSKVVDQPTEASLEKSACRQSSRRMPRCRYSPNCRQGVFSETPIHPLGCLCVRTGAKGRLARQRHNSTQTSCYTFGLIFTRRAYATSYAPPPL